MMSDLMPQPYTLPDSVQIDIASIVMLAASLDNLISVALFSITKLPATNGFVLVGRTAVSTKLKHLAFFTDALMHDSFCREFDDLNKRAEEFMQIRNALCHGVYIGKNVKGLMFSLTADFSESEGGYVNKIFQIKENELRESVKKGNQLIEWFKLLFGVSPWHESNPSKYVEDKPKTRRSIRKSDPAKHR